MQSGTSSICVLCTCQPGISSCEGCQRKFCVLCLTKHREELSLELDDLFNRRNEMLEMMQNQMPSHTTDRCPCFEEINRWQMEMHANIDRIATTARDHVRQRLAEASQNARTEFDRISQDLQQKQKTGGYVENDLNRIKQQLLKLNDTVQRFKEQIRIDTSNSRTIAWDSLLTVKTTKETPPPVVPASPASNSYYHQTNSVYPGRDQTTPVAPQYYRPNQSAPMPSPSSRSIYHRSSLPSVPVNRGSRSRTFTCVCCKTINNFNENGRNICSVCKSAFS